MQLTRLSHFFHFIRRNLFIDTKSLNHCETSYMYMYVEIGWRVGPAFYTKCDFTTILKDLIDHNEGSLEILTVAIDCKWVFIIRFNNYINCCWVYCVSPIIFLPTN